MKRKWLLTTILLLSFLTGCGADHEESRKGKNFTYNDTLKYQVDHGVKQLQLKMIDNNRVFPISDLTTLMDAQYEYDDLHRLLTINIGDHIFKLVYGVPVVEQNGIYLPTDEVSFFIEQEEVYLPLAFLEKALGLTLNDQGNMVSFQWSQQALPTSSVPSEMNDKPWTVEEMVKYLSFLKKPILDAEISTFPNHLPGAKRAYRNGFHEGIDWYAYAIGSHISFETPVYAMADGIVVRADHDYIEYPSADIRNKDLAITTELAETPLYIFDRLRGRQVWVQYEKGVMNRFAHLNAIPETLKVGDQVTSDTVIGFVGNSGTSGAVNGDGSELHLHQDILIYGDLFWKPFTLEEVREILVRVFGQNE